MSERRFGIDDIKRIANELAGRSDRKFLLFNAMLAFLLGGCVETNALAAVAPTDTSQPSPATATEVNPAISPYEIEIGEKSDPWVPAEASGVTATPPVGIRNGGARVTATPIDKIVIPTVTPIDKEIKSEPGTLVEAIEASVNSDDKVVVLPFGTGKSYEGNKELEDEFALRAMTAVLMNSTLFDGKVENLRRAIIDAQKSGGNLEVDDTFVLENYFTYNAGKPVGGVNGSIFPILEGKNDIKEIYVSGIFALILDPDDLKENPRINIELSGLLDDIDVAPEPYEPLKGYYEVGAVDGPHQNYPICTDEDTECKPTYAFQNGFVPVVIDKTMYIVYVSVQRKATPKNATFPKIGDLFTFELNDAATINGLVTTSIVRLEGGDGVRGSDCTPNSNASKCVGVVEAPEYLIPKQ